MVTDYSDLDGSGLEIDTINAKYLYIPLFRRLLARKMLCIAFFFLHTVRKVLADFAVCDAIVHTAQLYAT